MTDPYRERMAAFDALWARVRLFHARPFPTEWAKVANGVGLASFAMRAEKALGALFPLTEYKPSYLHSIRASHGIIGELRTVLATFDRFMPALPPDPRSYFEDLRSLVAEAVAFAREWWFAP